MNECMVACIHACILACKNPRMNACMHAMHIFLHELRREFIRILKTQWTYCRHIWNISCFRHLLTSCRHVFEHTLNRFETYLSTLHSVPLCTCHSDSDPFPSSFLFLTVFFTRRCFLATSFKSIGFGNACENLTIAKSYHFVGRASEPKLHLSFFVFVFSTIGVLIPEWKLVPRSVFNMFSMPHMFCFAFHMQVDKLFSCQLPYCLIAEPIRFCGVVRRVTYGFVEVCECL